MKHLKSFNQEKIDKVKSELLDDPAIYRGILRMLMSDDEIKAANQLVKDGILIKGKTDDKHSRVMYYLNDRT